MLDEVDGELELLASDVEFTGGVADVDIPVVVVKETVEEVDEEAVEEVGGVDVEVVVVVAVVDEVVDEEVVDVAGALPPLLSLQPVRVRTAAAQTIAAKILFFIMSFLSMFFVGEAP